MKKIFILSLLIIVLKTTFSQTFSELPINLPGVEQGSAIWGDYDNDNDFDIYVNGTDFTELLTFSSLYKNEEGAFVENENFLLNLISCNNPATWIDYDKDNDLDLYICSDIIRNDGNTFTANNFNLIQANMGSTSWVDYDNDDDLDLLITGNTEDGNKSILYQNNQTSFDPVFEFVGLIYSSADWGDYDNDNDMDLLITGAPDNSGIGDLVSYIYINEIDSFILDSTNILTGVNFGSAKWGDFDNDDDLDILLSGNINKTGSVNSYTRIFISDNGIFQESSIVLKNLHMSNVEWVDINDDMKLDIILTGADNQLVPFTKLYINNGLAGFDELESSIEDVYYASVDWVDYESDGDLDLLISGSKGDNFITKAYLNNLYTTSVDDEKFIDNIEVKLVNDELTIDFNNINVKNALINIIDIQGKKVFSKVNNSNILNVNTSNFSKGIYFVNLTYNNKNVTKKVVKY